MSHVEKNFHAKPEVGLKHCETIKVTEKLIVPAMRDSFEAFVDMPPVFATAYMIAFVEWTCIQALKPYLLPTQRSVGTHVDVSHVAATPINVLVTADIELIAIRDRNMRFRVKCFDEFDCIGGGFHERAIIDEQKFVRRAQIKSSSSSG